MGCIIFRPDVITKYTAGEIFDVEITGTVSGTISYTVTFVSINPITKITLDRDSLVLKQGEESQLNAEIAPYDADDVSLNWVSSNKDVATVEDGHIIALSAGETSITVSSADGSVSATCLVKVKDRYTVKFNTNGGSEINSQIIDEDETVTEPFEPIKNGYNFGGWYQDEALTTAWDFSMPVTGDMTLYAKWELIIDKTVMVGKKITFRTSRKIKKFTVSEKGIVNVSKSGKKMIVKGKKPGIVTVVAYDKNGYEVGSWVVEVKPRQ